MAALLSACADDDDATATPTAAAAPLAVQSPAFEDGLVIPTRFSCEGENISPALTWDEAPERTKSFAVIAYDPDAPGGTYTHWVLFDLPAETRGLPEAVEPIDSPTPGGTQGENDSGGIGYTGPCPPEGTPHHYAFTAYALDEMLKLDPGVSKDDLLSAMEGHVLAQGQTTGTYQR